MVFVFPKKTKSQTKQFKNEKFVLIMGWILASLCVGLAIYSFTLLEKQRRLIQKVEITIDKEFKVDGDLINANKIKAKTLRGRLTTDQQNNVTKVGRFKKDLHMGGNSIINVGNFQSHTTKGTLITAQQPNLTGFGNMTQNLNMGGNDLTNVGTVTANRFHGSFLKTASNQITQLGTQKAELDMGSNQIKSVGVLSVIENHSIILKTASVATRSTFFALHFANVEHIRHEKYMLYKPSVTQGDTVHIVKSGVYAITLNRCSVDNATSSSVYGWLGLNANITSRPDEQETSMAVFKHWNSVDKALYGHSSHVNYFSAGDTLSIIFTDATGQITISNPSDWQATFTFIH